MKQSSLRRIILACLLAFLAGSVMVSCVSTSDSPSDSSSGGGGNGSDPECDGLEYGEVMDPRCLDE